MVVGLNLQLVVLLSNILTLFTSFFWVRILYFLLYFFISFTQKSDPTFFWKFFLFFLITKKEKFELKKIKNKLVFIHSFIKIIIVKHYVDFLRNFPYVRIIIVKSYDINISEILSDRIDHRCARCDHIWKSDYMQSDAAQSHLNIY